MAQRVKKSVCRKTQGVAESGNSCLTTPGTCESCPDWAKQPLRRYKRPASSKAGLLRMVRKLFKENLELKRQTHILRELKEWLRG